MPTGAPETPPPTGTWMNLGKAPLPNNGASRKTHMTRHREKENPNRKIRPWREGARKKSALMVPVIHVHNYPTGPLRCLLITGIPFPAKDVIGTGWATQCKPLSLLEPILLEIKDSVHWRDGHYSLARQTRILCRALLLHCRKTRQPQYGHPA